MEKLQTKVNCQICNKEFKDLNGISKHLASAHKDISMSDYYFKNVNLDLSVEGKCKFCGNPAKFLGLTNGFRKTCTDSLCVKKAQSPFSKEYKMNVDGLSEEEYEKWSIQDRINKKKNTESGFQGKRLEYPDFDKKNSRYCKEFWLNKGYSDKESINLAYAETEKNRNKLKEIKINDPDYQKGKSWNSKEYWMNRGMSEDDSIKLVSEKQSTFSLEKCIEKYGENDGRKKWKERQEKWINTLDSKSDEEKWKILKKKIFLNTVHSKNSQELFNSIVKLSKVNENELYYATNSNGEKQIELDKKHLLKPDFLYKNKIIEFFGDYWHCNPKIKNSDFVIRRGKKTYTAESIWKIDKWRNEMFENNGYHVMVVWENDYNKDKKQTIDKCIQFLIN